MADPLFILAHGAGAPSASAWMQGWKARLATLGSVVSFDYPYMKLGRRSPDPQPKLIAAHREVLQEARASHDGALFLVGKSMGGRIGCHVALEEAVTGLICLGYPLQGQSGALRDEVLRALKTPILFVQGTRDALCPLDLLAQVRPTMTASNELYVVATGNHSLEATQTHLKAQGRSQMQIDADILTAIRGFVAAHSLQRR